MHHGLASVQLMLRLLHVHGRSCRLIGKLLHGGGQQLRNHDRRDDKRRGESAGVWLVQGHGRSVVLNHQRSVIKSISLPGIHGLGGSGLKEE